MLLGIRDLLEFVDMPPCITAGIAIIYCVAIFLRFFVDGAGAITKIKEIIPSREKKNLRVSDSLEQHGEVNLAAAFRELYKLDMTKRYAKRKTGWHIPNQITQALMMGFVLLMCMVFGWMLTLAADSEPMLSILFELLAIGLLLAICIQSVFLLFDVKDLRQVVQRIKATSKKRKQGKAVQRIAASMMRDIVQKAHSYCLVDARSREEFLKNGLTGAISVEEFDPASIKYRAVPVFFYSDFAGRATEKTAKWLKEGMQAYCLRDIEPDRFRTERIAIEMDFFRKDALDKGNNS